jgi:hypothetical protein
MGGSGVNSAVGVGGTGVSVAGAVAARGSVQFPNTIADIIKRVGTLSFCFTLIYRDYNTLMKNNLFSLLILIVIGIAAYMVVQTLRDTTQTATAPFQALNEQNQAMQTQMANLLNPTPTIIPDPVTYINEIRSLARLETIQYSIEKVVTCQVNQGTFDFAFGDKVLFVGHGVVIAGVDMEKLGPEDLRFQNGVLTVNLPPAEILIRCSPQSRKP